MKTWIILIPIFLITLSACTIDNWTTDATVIHESRSITTNSSEETKTILIQAYQEELLARDIYTYIIIYIPTTHRSQKHN